MAEKDAEIIESPEQVVVTSEEQTTPMEASLHVEATAGAGSGAESTDQDEQTRETEPVGPSETPDTSKSNSEQSCSSLADSMKKLQTASVEESTSSQPVFRVESTNQDLTFKIKPIQPDAPYGSLTLYGKDENEVEEVCSSLNDAARRSEMAYPSESSGTIPTSSDEEFMAASARIRQIIMEEVIDPILDNSTETRERTESLSGSREDDIRHEDIPKDSDVDDTQHEDSPPS